MQRPKTTLLILFLLILLTLQGCFIAGDIRQEMLFILYDIEKGMKGDISNLDARFDSFWFGFSVSVASQTLVNDLNWDIRELYTDAHSMSFDKEKTLELFQDYPLDDNIIFNFPEYNDMLPPIFVFAAYGRATTEVLNGGTTYYLTVLFEDQAPINPFSMKIVCNSIIFGKTEY